MANASDRITRGYIALWELGLVVSAPNVLEVAVAELAVAAVAPRVHRAVRADAGVVVVILVGEDAVVIGVHGKSAIDHCSFHITI